MPSAEREPPTASTRIGPLGGIRAVTFDLFDTLVEIDTGRLPRLTHDGRTLRTSAPAVLERLARLWPDLAATELASDYLRITREFWAEKEARGIELPARLRMERIVRELSGRSARPSASTETEVRDLALELVGIHMGILADAVRPIPAARPVLARLRAEGVPCLLISNFDHAATARSILDRHGLSPYLDHVVVSEDVGLRKPDRRIFEIARDALAGNGDVAAALEPGSVVHVGDDPVCDVAGAGALGWRTVWIDRSAVRRPEAPANAHPAPAATADAHRSAPCPTPPPAPTWRVTSLEALRDEAR